MSKKVAFAPSYPHPHPVWRRSPTSNVSRDDTRKTRDPEAPGHLFHTICQRCGHQAVVGPFVFPSEQWGLRLCSLLVPTTVTFSLSLHHWKPWIVTQAWYRDDLSCTCHNHPQHRWNGDRLSPRLSPQIDGQWPHRRPNPNRGMGEPPSLPLTFPTHPNRPSKYYSVHCRLTDQPPRYHGSWVKSETIINRILQPRISHQDRKDVLLFFRFTFINLPKAVLVKELEGPLDWMEPGRLSLIMVRTRRP